MNDVHRLLKNIVDVLLFLTFKNLSHTCINNYILLKLNNLWLLVIIINIIQYIMFI